MAKFRIRWAVVTIHCLSGPEKQRACIAEKKHWFGWWPIAKWRYSEDKALCDIVAYKTLHTPLPDAKEYY